MVPRRVRLSRAAGARLSPTAVSVAYPTRWANPHRPLHRDPAANAAAVAAYEADLLAGRLAFRVDDVRTHLSGRDLACWCAPHLPCHADVLLRLANEGPD